MSNTNEKTNRSDDAVDQFEAALRIKPYYAEAHNDLGVALSRIPKARIGEVAAEYGYSKIEDLHAALGYGKFSPRQVLQKLAPDQVPAEAAQAIPGARYVELDASHISNIEKAEAFTKTVLDFLTEQK